MRSFVGNRVPSRKKVKLIVIKIALFDEQDRYVVVNQRLGIAVLSNYNSLQSYHSEKKRWGQ